MKNQIVLAIVIFFISLILYIGAPNYYSYYYCLVVLFFFLITFFLIIKRTTIKNNYFTFHLLFLISFFFVNYVYPIFIYPLDPFHFNIFEKDFNHDIITKATALTMLGISAYYIGVVLVRRKENKMIVKVNRNFLTLQLLLSVVILLLFTLVVLFGGLDFLSGNFGSSSKIPAGLLALFQVSLGLLILFTAYSRRYTNRIDLLRRFKPVLLILIIHLILFMLIGDRGPVIQITLIVIAAFSLYVRSIKLKTFVVLVLSGMIFLTFISYARTRSIYDSQNASINISRGFQSIKINSFFDIGMDLIINNRNLYVGYEIVDKKGINYGKSLMHFIFAPIPLLPGLYTKIVYNANPEELSSARLITEVSNSSYGLGTNLIADLYMAYGTLGVVYLMLFLGYVSTKAQFMTILSDNFIATIVYVFLVAYSIYLPRTMIFEPVRYIFWAIILFKFLESLRLLFLQMSPNKKAEIFKS